VRELAQLLIDLDAICWWQGGLRKLSALEKQAKLDFYEKHGKYHTDS